MAAIWLTLDQVKWQLKMDTPTGDVDDVYLTLEMEAAEGAVINYIRKTPRGRANADTWTNDPTTLPANVRRVMLYMVGEFDMYRGDTPQSVGPQRSPDRDFPDAVLGILRQYTDPVLA